MKNKNNNPVKYLVFILIGFTLSALVFLLIPSLEDNLCKKYGYREYMGIAELSRIYERQENNTLIYPEISILCLTKDGKSVTNLDGRLYEKQGELYVEKRLEE